MNPYARLVSLLDDGTPCCVLLVLSAEGSTPREAAVRAVVEVDGTIHGTIGGGTVEARAQAAAVEACRTGVPAVLDIELTGDAVGDAEPVCGGRMRVLVDPTAAKDRAAYARAAEALARRECGALITAIEAGDVARTRVRWAREEELSAVTEASEALVEPVVPDPRLIIAGGGHIGQALARQAALLGFEVLVVDDRPEFADAALYPAEATTICADTAETLRALPLAEDSYVVIVTRGHRHDQEALRACVQRPHAYLGMIGSRRKVALLRASLLQEGAATEEEFAAIHAPIGLDLGAETVPEIAASIAAQLVAVRRRGPAARGARDMRDR
jgi:xanthine dehydrogenase accessory factor